MRNYFFFLTLGFLINLSGLSQDYSNPGSYMAFFSEQYKNVAKDQWQYARLVARGKGARRIENKRQDLIKTTREAELAIKKLRGFEGDESLRDSVASFFALSYIVLKEDYGEIMDLEEVAEQSYDAMEALIMARELAGEKLEKANKRVMNAQQDFAKRHNVELRENNDELFANLDKASEVFDYYNALYLIFFKSHKQEGYMVEAMNKGDINGMEQNKSALASVADEGLGKLKEHKSFMSDPKLRMACEKVLDFHKEEAEEKMPVVINFFVQKENYDKVKANMEGKKKKDVTQEDVDAYNSATNAFNAAVNEFNTVNNELNAKRDLVLNEWNEAVEKFLDRHIPK